ncbi:MAG: methyltransferase domain-containing protein [Vicinamibacterales bacterium]|nr:methyltransferase domain-containing protein [Vicinamibacterales bacterium]
MSGIAGSARAWVKARVSPKTLVTLRILTRGLPRPRWGNFRRVRPFSTHFGFERGTPVDRYYLHRFLDQHRAVITGRVLEIQLPGYTEQYGHDVTASHTVDVVTTANPSPSYHVDLAHSDGVIPDASYDCFLLPNTLSFLRDLEGCLRQALRVVKPGGVILASSGCHIPLTPDTPDYWHLTGDGWREVTSLVWPDCEVEVTQYGNCLAATAAMMGLAAEELTPAELDAQDPRYPVQVTILCRRPAL